MSEGGNCTYKHGVLSWSMQTLMMRSFISLNIQNLSLNLGAFSMLSLINQMNKFFYFVTKTFMYLIGVSKTLRHKYNL